MTDTKSTASPARPICVAIVCNNASLKMGGESARPVHYFRTMRERGVDVYLCVHERCRPELSKLLGPDIDRVRFAPDTGANRLLHKIGRPFPHQFSISTFGTLSQLLTQRHQRRLLRELIAKNGVQLVHQPIPISPKQPSGIMNLGVPVVMGPMNGDINYPPAFGHMENRLVRWSVLIGRAGGQIANYIIPGKRHAAAVLVSNERTERALPKAVRGRVIRLIANAVDMNTWDAPRQINPAEPRFGFLGRLVDFKMVDLLLEAFVPVAQATPARLEIVGEGDQRTKLQELANRLGVGDRVTFHGWKNYNESAEILSKCYALVFPSLRECGGAVVMEAMSAGVPVVAAHWGGPADYVGDDDAGFLVRPDTREGFVAGLTDAMMKLADDVELVRKMSDNARRRADREFQWSSRVDALLEVYSSLINPTASIDTSKSGG